MNRAYSPFVASSSATPGKDGSHWIVTDKGNISTDLISWKDEVPNDDPNDIDEDSKPKSG
mgnify:CR=1 FL=1